MSCVSVVLPGAGGADERDDPSRPGCPGRCPTSTSGPVVGVGERHAVELHVATRPAGRSSGSGALDQIGVGVEHLEDALAARRGPLGVSDERSDHPEREHQRQQVLVELDELAERQLAVDRADSAEDHHTPTGRGSAGTPSGTCRTPACGWRPCCGRTPGVRSRRTARSVRASWPNALMTRMPTMLSSALCVTSADLLLNVDRGPAGCACSIATPPPPAPGP